MIHLQWLQEMADITAQHFITYGQICYIRCIRKKIVSTEQDLVQHLDQVNKVVEEYLKGNDPTRISKQLAIPRQQVVSLINEWKVMASANDAIRARAKEALVAADTHYSKLITKAYEVIEDATTSANLNAKSQGLKLVLDIEKSRAFRK
jgi:hypothetical protein